MKYQTMHLHRLQIELDRRFESLRRSLCVPNDYSMPDFVEIDGTEIRLAVDDFKTILVEIRKLK